MDNNELTKTTQNSNFYTSTYKPNQPFAITNISPIKKSTIIVSNHINNTNNSTPSAFILNNPQNQTTQNIISQQQQLYSGPLPSSNELLIHI